ncbi:hypothetical protein [Halopiger goleimassiliensis]|uniref:hypothetical protein n=1 Tax=Halopiger goleimassiliensis TaxID=1293048 RepID=UPI000A3F7E33|nr:hypothetical protein [Halopiger goleimassiliensis]
MQGVKISLLGINLVLVANALESSAWALAYLGAFLSFAGIFVGSGHVPSGSE